MGDFWSLVKKYQKNNKNQNNQQQNWQNNTTSRPTVTEQIGSTVEKFKSSADEFWQKVSKYQQESDKGMSTLLSNFGEKVENLNSQIEAKRTSRRKEEEEEEEDIAPVDEGLQLFRKSNLFEDGYDRWDISKTILATGKDALVDVYAGILGMGEKAVDAGATYIGKQADVFGLDGAADKLKGFVAKDLYDETEVARKMVNPAIAWQLLDRWGVKDEEEASVLGKSMDSYAQSGGQLLGQAALNAVGVPWFVTSGVTSFGGEAEQAFQNDASYNEAVVSGLITAGAEILSEKISGGIKFGGKTLDDALVKGISQKISNKAVQFLAKLGLDMAGEGAEEVLSEFTSAIGKKLTYMDDMKLKELFTAENALESFLGGVFLGGGGSVINAAQAKIAGVDVITGLSKSETAVAEKVVGERVEKMKKNGEEVTDSKKSEIFDAVVEEMKQGDISVEDIEKILGGDSYKAYEDTVKNEDAQIQEIEQQLKALEGEPNTVGNAKKYDSLQNQLEDLKGNSQRDQLRSKASEDVLALLKGERQGKGSYLMESYNERERRRQAFQADVTQYDEKQRAAVQSAIDSGILNNSNKTHKLVDFIAKISSDIGVTFDFTNNQKLKESGFSVEGASINGYKIGNGITLNVQSKKALNSVVGHEIVHVLKGGSVELYQAVQDAAFEYANTKGEYDTRLEALTKLYEGQNTDVNEELTADLVGDYLFQDSDFIKHLSVKDRNAFQKVWDEVKHMLKLATAGSDQARKLEQVQHEFEKAYRELGKKNNATFSMETPVEVKPNLVAMHNITQDQLQEALGRGGLIMPSLAVTNNAINEFGDISIIFNSNTIDPASDPSNKMYGTDAWTPTQTNLKKNAQFDTTVTESTVENIKSQIGTEYAGTLFNVTPQQFIDTIVNADGSIYDAYAQNMGMQTAYAMENGLISEIPVNKNGSVDTMALQEMLDKELDTDNGWRQYKRWLNNISDTVITSYDAATNEDILRNMEQQPAAAKTFKLTESGELVVPVTEYTSLDQAKENRGRVSTDADAAVESTASEFMNLVDGISSKTGANTKAIVQAVNAAFDFRYDVSGITNVFRQNGIELSRNMALELQELYQQTVELPTRYFEAKPHRNVSFDEAAVFVVPNNINPELKQQLLDNGYHVEVYDPNVEGDRNRVVNQNDDYKFSISENADGAQGMQKNNTAISGVKYSLTEYTDQQKQNWSTSKRIVIYDNPQQLSQFIQDSISNKTLDKKMYFGSIPSDLAARIQEDAGVDVENYNLSLGSYEIRKILKDHGNEATESLRGQRAVVEDDFAHIVDIVLNPQSVTLSESTYNGKPAIIFTGEHNGRMTVVAVVSDKRLDLFVQTAYVNIKKGNLSTPTGEQAPINTPEANNGTVSEITVAQNGNDVKSSLSPEGEVPTKHGDWTVYGKDVRLQEDIAPVSETAAETAAETKPAAPVTKVEDLFPDDTADVHEEYEFLVAERDDIADAISAYAEIGDLANAERLMPEYEDLQKRIAQMESEDSERLASLEDSDAPPEIDNTPEDVADNVPLTKTLVAEIAKDVRTQLGLPANRVAEVRDLIQRYAGEEFPSKAHLYTEIADRFGTYTETYVDEDLRGVKSMLRKSGIYVDDSIKGDFPDYGQLVKSNFGKVRFSKDGLPVDVAYQEFQDALPGYFPDSIIVPSDQLQRIIEVANMETVMKQDQAVDSETLERITDLIANGVNEFKQNKKEFLANKHGRESFDSLMESADQYAPPIQNIAPVRTRPQVQADSQDIAPTFDTSTGQQAFMPEEPKKLTRKELHQNKMDDIKNTFREKGFDFDDVLKNAKDLSTFATVDNTPQRVMEKALGYKQGQVLSDLTVNQVAQNETKGIQWLNSFTDSKTGLLPKIAEQYNIKPGSKASAAAQMYAEGFYVGENDAIIAYGDAELAADFPNPKVQENIKGLARDPRIRQIYDETLAAINESRTRNAYPEIPRLDNYFLHFRAMEDTFSKLGLPFNPNDIRAKDLPTDLNGVTADLKPGQPYFASAMHRKGKRTSFDLLGGLENYLTSAKNQIYHIDDIQTLRALRNYVAETYGQAQGLENLDTLSDEEAEQRIEQVYNSHLSTFAKFLNEEANVLAGKTALIDRGLEGVIGRRGMTFLNTLNGQVGANMVGFNVSSSLTNFLAPVQAFAKSNKFDFVKAMAQTASNKISSIFGKGDNFAQESPVMIRRRGAERFYRTPFQQVADVGYVMMGVVDNISTELIARTKYNEFTRQGMDSQQAHIETDKWVSRLMGDRSLGQQPQLYNSKTLGLITKFQLEVRNQLDSQFYDTIQEAKVSTEQIENKLERNAKTAAKITSTFVQLAVMQHLFGKAFESVAGYNPSFDIIDVLIKTFGWDDDEEDEDTVLDNIEEGFLELLGDLPYTSTLTGGRIPIASALPVTELIKGVDQYGNDKSRWDTLMEAAPYYFLPGGYGQMKKTMAGLSMFDEDLPTTGSYTDSGKLRFPVEDTFGNKLQAGLFGQWASENARDYFDNEWKPLDEKQIEEFMESGMTIQDYHDYRDGLKGLDKLSEKADYIDSLDIPTKVKNLFVNNQTDRKEDIDMKDYGDYGSFEEFDFAQKNPEMYDFLLANNVKFSKYKRFDEDTKQVYSWAFKNPEKYQFLKDNGVSLEDYSDFDEEARDAYTWAYENQEKLPFVKAVSEDLVEYRRIAGELYDIKADKDQNGKSISGSRKKKVIEYINSLDIEYGAKLILFKSEYSSFDDNNKEIVEYLNGRSDLKFEEKLKILGDLGFTVYQDGTIKW